MLSLAAIFREITLCFVFLSLACIPDSFAETAVCDQQQARKICLQLDSSQDNSVWLWFTPACEDNCTLFDDELVNQFYFVEMLPEKEFGMGLLPMDQGYMYWSGCSLDKNGPVIPASMNFPVTRSENLNLFTNEFEPALIKDLTRIHPNKQELLKRHQDILASEAWVSAIFTHTLAFITSFLLMYCCHQCGY